MRVWLLMLEQHAKEITKFFDPPGMISASTAISELGGSRPLTVRQLGMTPDAGARKEKRIL
jgi:hypothetical protein